MELKKVEKFPAEQNESLHIQIQKFDKVEAAVTVFLSGYIDTYNSNRFLNQITELTAKGFIRFIFMCGELKYISITGIETFTNILKELTPLGGEIILTNLQPKVYEVFQLLGFSQSFHFLSNLEEVTQHFLNNLPLPQNSFPKSFNCLTCGTKLKATKAGRFRCFNCKTILTIDNNAKIFLVS